jgi:hypothetical protein
MGYSDPNYQVRREHIATTVAGATTEGCKFRSFQKMRLKNVHVAVVTAGTAAGHGLDLYRGTTSVGTISLGTNTAGYTASMDTAGAGLDLTYASMEQASVKSLVDATGVAQVVYEYEVLPDASQTL